MFRARETAGALGFRRFLTFRAFSRPRPRRSLARSASDVASPSGSPRKKLRLSNRAGDPLRLLPSRSPIQGRPRNDRRISPTVRGGAGIVRRHDEVGAASIGGWTFRGVGGTTVEARRLHRCALGDSHRDNARRSGGRRAQGAGDRRLEVPGEDRLGRGRHHPRPLRDHARDPRERLPGRPVRTERGRGATGRTHRRCVPLREAEPRSAGIRAPRRTISSTSSACERATSCRSSTSRRPAG